DDAPRVVDNCTEAARIEGAGDVGRGAALAAKTGNEKPGVRHCLAKFHKLCRVCSAHDRSDSAISTFASRCRRKLVDVRRYSAIDGFVATGTILEKPATWIRGLHQNKHAGAALGRGL